MGRKDVLFSRLDLASIADIVSRSAAAATFARATLSAAVPIRQQNLSVS